MIIGLTGKAKAGKDTAYDIIYKNFNVLDRPVVKKSFAEPLKKSVAALFNIKIEDMDDFKDSGTITVWARTDGLPMNNLSGRELLQRYGTEAHREVFGSNFWVDRCFPKEADYPDKHIIVATDVRFDNEAKRIRDLGGVIWEIRRGKGNLDRSPLPDDHSSENGLTPELVDLVIDNVEDDLRELERRVVDATHRLLTTHPMFL